LACPRKLEPGLYELCLGLMRETGFQARIVQEAAHIQTLMGLVAAGVGICLVLSSATHLHRTGIIYRPISAAGEDSEAGSLDEGPWSLPDRSIFRCRPASGDVATNQPRHQRRLLDAPVNRRDRFAKGHSR
jgi:LysR substrate binding domain